MTKFVKLRDFRSLNQSIVIHKTFEWFIAGVILVNCTFIGIETYFTSPEIRLVQSIALGIFTIEIILRWIAKENIKRFFANGWNIFDLLIVLVSYIPESIFADATLITTIRVLRAFRIIRLLRAFPELKLMLSVIVRSLRSLAYNAIFFFIFMYLFSVIGVTLFKLPDPATAADYSTSKALSEYLKQAPNAPSISPDPYGSLGETMFTLFRIVTGEDWTDLRYNLILASKMNLIPPSETIITIYHVLWFVVAAFLLLNLLLGAILTNYQIIIEEHSKNKKL